MISAELCHYTTKFNSERHKSTKIFSIHSSKILFFPYSLYYWAFQDPPCRHRRCKGSTSPLSMQANFVNASIHFAVVLPLLHNDDAKQMQIESRTCQACLGNYAEMQLCLSKVSTNPSTCPNLVCNPPTLVCKHSILHVQTPNNC